MSSPPYEWGARELTHTTGPAIIPSEWYAGNCRIFRRESKVTRRLSEGHLLGTLACAFCFEVALFQVCLGN